MTTKITIKNHLQEYIIGKFYDEEKVAVRFPDSIDLYHTIYDLLEKRPMNIHRDCGNLEIFLPERSTGKKTSVYNYLGYRSVLIIQKKIETMMFAELHDLLDEQKHRYGIEYINTIHAFACKYSITSISEDAFLKNYYRWRNTIRKKNKRREYRKTA